MVVSRSLVNLIYGGRRRLASLSIGQVWKPGVAKNNAAAVPAAKKPATSN